MTEAIDTKQQKKQHLKEVQRKLLCFGEIFLNDTTFPLSQNKNNKKKNNRTKKNNKNNRTKKNKKNRTKENKRKNQSLS
jgi:hypothetical protein